MLLIMTALNSSSSENGNIDNGDFQTPSCNVWAAS